MTTTVPAWVGVGVAGHPSFNFRVRRVGEQRIHIGDGDDIRRFVALPIWVLASDRRAGVGLVALPLPRHNSRTVNVG